MNPSVAPRVLVCFAVREEAGPFRSRAASDVELLVTGMGPVNARGALERRLTSDRALPKRVLTCGFAGGLAPNLEVGSVLFDLDPGLESLGRRMAEAGAVPGRILCTDRVATTVEAKRRLREASGCDAVEMESGVIRAWCRERGVPSGTLRVISDAADQDLPVDFNALMTADYRLSFPRLAWTILRSPGVIGGLRRLQARCALAAEQLARVLEAGLPKESSEA